MISGPWVSTYLRANSTIRFVISLRLKGMNGRQQTLCPPSKRLLFFYWRQTRLLPKSFTLQDRNVSQEEGRAQLSAFSLMSFFPLAAVKENPILPCATSMSHLKKGGC